MKKVATILLIATLIVFIAACTKDSVSNDIQSTLATIVCEYCKASISSEVKFCPECGMKIFPNDGSVLEESTESTFGSDDQAAQDTIACKYCKAIISPSVRSCPECGMDNLASNEQPSEEIYWEFWPNYADDSWHRFHSYGGTFYIDQWNTWICNIGGSAITWVDNQWTYSSPAGDYFLQYDGSDYFHVDTSDPYYSWNMNSLTGWVQMTASGMVSCAEPQIFRDNVEALKQSIYDTNLKNKIACFESMGFQCYNEDGVWKCDTYSGILTYDEGSRVWSGCVDIFNCQDDTWEYDVEIMVKTNLLSDTRFRYADGRYDKGEGCLDSDTDYYSGFTYNINNYGLPGSTYYNNSAVMTDGDSYVDILTGIPNFTGFYIYEYNYPVSIHEEDLSSTDFKITMNVNSSTTLIMFKEFQNSFGLTCEYDNTSVLTEWGTWQTHYYTPRIELKITALKAGTSFIKVYSKEYPQLYHMIEITVTEQNKFFDKNIAAGSEILFPTPGVGF